MPELKSTAPLRVLTMARRECTCASCQRSCENVPGAFLPGEAEVVARARGVTLRQLFKSSLTVDYYFGKGRTFYYLRPASHVRSRGDLAPYDPRGTACVFFKDGQCIIHAVKPFECAVTTHEEGIGGPKVRAGIALKWRGHQAQIRRLLGRRPHAPQPSFSDTISLMFGGFGF